MPFETDPDFENRMEEYFSMIDAAKSMAELQADNKVLRAWKAEAMEVLRKFAQEADEWVDDVPDGYHPGITEPGHDQAHTSATFSLGDLRAARRLVEKEDGR